LEAGRSIAAADRITQAELVKNLAGSKNMATHGGDHRPAFCLGRVEVQLCIKREYLEIIGMGCAAFSVEVGSSVAYRW